MQPVNGQRHLGIKRPLDPHRVGHGDRSSVRLRLAGLAVLGLVSQEIEDLSLIP